MEKQEYKPGSGKFKPGSEPEGFRGIKWGTDINTLSRMKYSITDPSYGGVQYYIREVDELKIGGATLERIEYGFWRGKFCDVIIYTTGYVNFNNLKQVVFKKFGKGYQKQKDGYIESYYWWGENTLMMLDYDLFSQEGCLFMSSKEMLKQMREYEKQKAKEWAEKGF